MPVGRSELPIRAPSEDSGRDLADSIADAQGALHLAGERLMTFFHPAAGKHLLWPGVKFHLGKTDATIAAGGSGAVSVWEVSGSGHADSSKNVTAYDWAGQGIDAAEPVYLWQHLQTPRRWFALRAAAAGAALVRFELTAALSLGGSAAAKKVVWDGAAYALTDSITVRDFTSGSWRGPSGYRGWAIHLPDRADYEIVFLESKAQAIQFTLSAAMSGGSAAASVNAYFQGRDPGSTTTVYDPQGLFPRALSGAKGKAIYDEREDKFKIVACQTKALWIRFSLPSALAKTDASKASCSVDDYWQGQSPGASVTIHNIPAGSNYIFEGASGAKGLACYDDIDDAYRIVQMECP